MPRNNNQVRVVEGYEIHETLGSGLQGKVKLGVHVATGTKVALKLIKQDQLTQQQVLSLVKEVEAMQRTAAVNPHILALLAVHQNVLYPKKNNTTSKVVMLVLELATGGEIFDILLNTGAFSENVSASYFTQLLSGLGTCHEIGIFHRDLKPENLLLDSNFQLKIADFGLAGIIRNPSSQLFTQCGTRGYMAPEVLDLANDGYDGSKADIWSAGVVLFIMLAGFPPFAVADMSDWWFKAIALGQYDAFWAAHSRKVSFSEGAMSLLSQIFVIDPASRITLREMRNHPWLLRLSKPHNSIATELAHRHDIIMHQKKSSSIEKQMSNTTFDPFSQSVMRSVKPLSTAVVARYTTTVHSSTLSFTGLKSRIKSTLLEKHSKVFNCSSENKIKAKVGKSVVLVVEVSTSKNGKSFASIVRRSGDIFEFQRIYKQIVKSVSDVVDTTGADKSFEPLLTNEPLLIY